MVKTSFKLDYSNSMVPWATLLDVELQVNWQWADRNNPEVKCAIVGHVFILI